MTVQREQHYWRSPSNVCHDCPEGNSGQVTQAAEGMVSTQQTETNHVSRGCYNKGLLLQHDSHCWRRVCDNSISPSGLRCYLCHGAKRFHCKPAGAALLKLVLNKKASCEEEHPEQRCFQCCTKSPPNSQCKIYMTDTSMYNHYCLKK